MASRQVLCATKQGCISELMSEVETTSTAHSQTLEARFS